MKRNLLSIYVALHLILCGCGAKRFDHDKPQAFAIFLKSVDSAVKDIFVQDKQIHVRILLDSSNIGCDEQWNFKNLGLALAIASNNKWCNYIDSNDYSIYLHRALDFEHGDFDYYAGYSANDIIELHSRFPDAQKVSREIDYVADNFSCSEFHEMYLVLHEFRPDSIFLSQDTCFSQLFSNCRANKNSKSCIDIEKLRSMFDEALQKESDPILQSLHDHFIELEKISSTK